MAAFIGHLTKVLLQEERQAVRETEPSKPDNRGTLAGNRQ